MNLKTKDIVPFEEALDKTEFVSLMMPKVEASLPRFPNAMGNWLSYLHARTMLLILMFEGNGLYNILLVCTCACILLAVGVDLFGFSLVVTAACDLNLTVTEKGILTSLPFIGILVTSYFWGYVSDTRGRRFTLIVSLFVGFTLSVVCSFCYHWLLLGLVKFFSVCFSCAAQSATYTLLGESCVQRVRSKYMLLMTSMLLLSPATAAVITYPVLMLNVATKVPWLGLVITPWRLLIIILALPSGISGLAIYFCYESPKFLANSGRADEAVEVLRGIHKINHKFGSSSESNGYEVTSFLLEEGQSKKEVSLFYALYEQSAILFRPPLLTRTVQLFYIVAVVYITNNSFLVWLPHILNLVKLSMDTQDGDKSNVCALISTIVKDNSKDNNTINFAEKLSNGTWSGFGNETFFATDDTIFTELNPDTCTGRIDENVILTLIASQSLFSFLNLVISYLPGRRKTVLITVLCTSSLSGVMLNLTPESISSVMFFVLFTCTCLGMGILASYFVELYPTSHRGMVSCLSIMVGRTSTFIGINLVGNVIFSHCQITFYLWSLLLLTSVVAACFLPPDKPAPLISRL